MSDVRSMAELAPLIISAVEAGGEFKLVTRGTSMLPLLRDGVDTAVLVKKPVRLKKGDVPLFVRENGQFVLHRAVKVYKDGSFDARGDNQGLTEKGVKDTQVVAVMTAVIRDGVRTDFGSKKDRAYRRKLPFAYGKRCLRRFLARVKRKIFGA